MVITSLVVTITSTGIVRANTELIRVELELLIAIDVSNSVSDDEFALQVHGIANAFQDRDVQLAIKRAGPRGIAIAVMQWAGDNQQVRALDWVRITTPLELNSLTSTILAMPRQFYGGDTRIGNALLFGASDLQQNKFLSRRQVMDVSGDGGVENIGITRFARDRAIALGITINGLAIENEVSDLNVFYRDNVIGGNGAFVITARDYVDFSNGIRRKLIREIDDQSLSYLSR